MEIAVIHFIILGVISGLTKGAGVLPDGPLHRAVGETVMFTTTLTPPETPFVSVNWKFSGKNIITYSGVNNIAPEYEGRITFFMSTGSLELMNLTLNDSGVYSVTIIPFGQPQTNGNTTLDVHEEVSNVMATASSTDLVEFNSSVHLSCSSTGSSLSFLWLNRSSEVTASDRVQLTDGGANLTIVNVTRYDQGPFRCHVSNPVSNGTSDPVNLTINYGPDNVQIRGPNELPLDETLTLTCSAESVPASYTWTLNGTEIHSSAIYTKNNTEPSDSGNYTCEVMNYLTWRISTAVHELTVTEEVSNVMATASSTDLVESSSSVRLSCSSTGSSLSFLWLNGTSEVTASDRVQLTDGGANLTIVNVTRYDQGPFRCHVSNPVSNGTSGPINFNISYGPENVQIRGPNEIHLKETLTLTCSAESVPASYTWTLNEKKIHYSAVYTKNNIEPSDSGNYICEVMNNKTGRTSSAVHELTVTDWSLSGGAIAGIVIACLVVLSAVAGGGYYIHKKKIDNKAPPQSDNKEVEECVYENMSIHENTIYENMQTE